MAAESIWPRIVMFIYLSYLWIIIVASSMNVHHLFLSCGRSNRIAKLSVLLAKWLDWPLMCMVHGINVKQHWCGWLELHSGVVASALVSILCKFHSSNLFRYYLSIYLPTTGLLAHIIKQCFVYLQLSRFSTALCCLHSFMYVVWSPSAGCCAVLSALLTFQSCTSIHYWMDVYLSL